MGVKEARENMISKTIKLRCINCGKEFEQAVEVKSKDKLEKEIEWYKRNQKHCPRCRMARMGHGGGQGPA
ncbi:MAG: hypothetical protein IJH22_04830 [Firmicutes bacterium]|nr:hypothetical protein [Bacillota bacterium]